MLSENNSLNQQNKNQLTFFDLCAGIGGGRLGLERHGFTCLNFAEIDEKAILSYQLLHEENHCGMGNLSDINTDKLPSVDAIVAGFPCQSYSIVGKRKGLTDHRGQVIYGISRILQEKKVPYFILENVKGLVNINKGQDFQIILELLDSSGYAVQYKVLNSLDFAVPHSRERIYFVGIRKDLKISSFEFPQGQKQEYDLSLFLDKSDKIEKNTPPFQTFLRYLGNKYNANRFDLCDLLSQDYLVLDTRQSDLRLYRGYVPTIRKGRQGILYVYGGELFSLSKNDALRMQGYTSDYIDRLKTVSKSTVLEQVGNAMTINVIEAIAGNLKKAIFNMKGDI
ncbi:MAG: DNA (cytosine-5-)-methyltransferase [Treponemataceae bacterium]